MLRDRLLSLATGVRLGAASIMLIVVICTSKDLATLQTIMLAILFGVGLGMALTMYLLERFKLFLTEGQRQNQIQGQGEKPTCVEECTYHDPLQTFCRSCNPRMLMDLARNIPNSCLMTQLGLELGVNANVIETCINDSNGITQAVYNMLYNKWYKSQEDLIQEGLEFDWKSKLKQALEKIGLGNLIPTVIESHR